MFGQSLSLPLFLLLACFSSVFCDCFLFLLNTMCVSQLSGCCAMAGGCSIKMGSFVLQFDNWEADSSCWRFKRRQTRCPLSRRTNTKTLQRQRLPFSPPVSLSRTEFQGQRCLWGPTRSIIILLLIFLFYFILQFNER